MAGATGLVAHRAFVPGLAHTLPTDDVALPVVEVAVAAAVTARPPPALQALAVARVLVTGGEVAVTAQTTLQSPVVPLAHTLPRHRVTRGRALGEALAHLGAGARPPALVTGAVAVQWVAVAVVGALALVLAQRAPAFGVAGALARGRVAAPVGMAQAELTAV